MAVVLGGSCMDTENFTLDMIKAAFFKYRFLYSLHLSTSHQYQSSLNTTTLNMNQTTGVSIKWNYSILVESSGFEDLLQTTLTTCQQHLKWPMALIP